MKKVAREPLVFFLLLSIPVFSFADWNKLYCTQESGFTVYIDFDEQKQIAKVAGDLIVPAKINEQSIYFKAKINGGTTWIHTINRTTGVLMVKKDSPDGALLAPHYCQPFDASQRKF